MDERVGVRSPSGARSSADWTDSANRNHQVEARRSQCNTSNLSITKVTLPSHMCIPVYALLLRVVTTEFHPHEGAEIHIHTTRLCELQRGNA